MFLKKRLINGIHYFSLVESYRDKSQNGKIKQRVIESLGNAEKAYELLRDRKELSHFLPRIKNELLPKKYHTIYADPPWMEAGAGQIKRGANRHYPLLKTEDIAKLRIQGITAENCHLYLWVTNNFLQDGLHVMKCWGFRYVTKITWIKGIVQPENTMKLQHPGLGQYFRGQDEVCLFGVKGNLPYKQIENRRKQGTTVIVAPRGRHSQKPAALYELIERVSFPPYIELFSRKRRKNWDIWGNELENDIDLNR